MESLKYPIKKLNDNDLRKFLVRRPNMHTPENESNTPEIREIISLSAEVLGHPMCSINFGDFMDCWHLIKASGLALQKFLHLILEYVKAEGTKDETENHNNLGKHEKKSWKKRRKGLDLEQEYKLKCILNTVEIIRIFIKIDHSTYYAQEASRLLYEIEQNHLILSIPFLEDIVRSFKKLYKLDTNQNELNMIEDACNVGSTEIQRYLSEELPPIPVTPRSFRKQLASVDVRSPSLSKQTEGHTVDSPRHKQKKKPKKRNSIFRQQNQSDNRPRRRSSVSNLPIPSRRSSVSGPGHFFRHADGERDVQKVPRRALPVHSASVRDFYISFREHVSLKSMGQLRLPMAFLRILAQVAAGEEGFGTIPSTVVDLLIKTPAYLEESPEFAQSRATALMFMLRTFLVYRPTTDTRWVEEAMQVVRAISLWPAPCSTLAHEILFMLEKEAQAPGTSLREILLRENLQLLDIKENPLTMPVRQPFARPHFIPEPIGSRRRINAEAIANLSKENTFSDSDEESVGEGHFTIPRDFKKTMKGLGPDSLDSPLTWLHRRWSLMQSLTKNSSPEEHPQRRPCATPPQRLFNFSKAGSSSHSTKGELDKIHYGTGLYDEVCSPRGGEGAVLAFVDDCANYSHQLYASLFDRKCLYHGKSSDGTVWEDLTGCYRKGTREKTTLRSQQELIRPSEKVFFANPMDTKAHDLDDPDESDSELQGELLTHLMECHFDLAPQFGPNRHYKQQSSISAGSEFSATDETASLTENSEQEGGLVPPDPLGLFGQMEQVGFWLEIALNICQDSLGQLFEDGITAADEIDIHLCRESRLTDLLSEIQPKKNFTPFRIHDWSMFINGVEEPEPLTLSEIMEKGKSRDASYKSAEFNYFTSSKSNPRAHGEFRSCYGRLEGDEVHGCPLDHWTSPPGRPPSDTILPPPGDPTIQAPKGFNLRHTPILPDIQFNFQVLGATNERDHLSSVYHCWTPHAHILEHYLRASLQVVKKVSRTFQPPTPPKAKVVLMGGNPVIHHFVCAYVALLLREPEILKLENVEPWKQMVLAIYVVPEGDNMIARYLAMKDRWYCRELYHLFVGPPPLAPSLYFPGSCSPQASLPKNGTENCSVANTLPMQLLRAGLQHYVRHADVQNPAVVFECRAWKSDFGLFDSPSDEDTPEATDHSEPDVIIPFLMSAEIGLLADIEEFKKMRSDELLTLKQILSDENFVSDPVDLKLRFNEMKLDGSESMVATVDENSYANISLTNLPETCQQQIFRMEGVTNNNIEAKPIHEPWLMLHRRHANGALGEYMYDRAHGLVQEWMQSIKTPDSFLDPCSIGRIEVEASMLENSYTEEFKVLLDGTIHGPFRKIQIQPCRIWGARQPLTVDLMSFLPVSD